MFLTSPLFSADLFHFTQLKNIFYQSRHLYASARCSAREETGTCSTFSPLLVRLVLPTVLRQVICASGNIRKGTAEVARHYNITNEVRLEHDDAFNGFPGNWFSPECKE